MNTRDMPESYRVVPEKCLHKGSILIDWMTPVLGKPPIPGVMWIERCMACGGEIRRVPYPAPEPSLSERLAAWWEDWFR